MSRRPLSPAAAPSLPPLALEPGGRAVSPPGSPRCAVRLGLLALGLLFREEVAAATRVWNNSATYNHCWLILPIAGWLAWTRRHRLVGLRPSRRPPSRCSPWRPRSLGWRRSASA
jgi:hypothetical protein